jgi:tetratricopeptide (TPR) repeat protein
MPRLLPPSALLALGSVLVCLLLLLLPDRDELEERIAAHAPDQLSLTYLELALKETPHDSRLRLLLARQYHEMSRCADALSVLAPLLDASSPAGREARMLAIRVQHTRCTGIAGDRSGCPAAVVAAIDAVLEHDQPLSAELLELLAEISMANGAPGHAGDFYSKLADASDHAIQRAAWRNAASFAYLQAERPERAAAVQAQAAREQPGDQVTSHVENAVANLRRAAKQQGALALTIEGLERAPRNGRLLELGFALALENERPDLAAELGRRLLALEPDDPGAIARQLSAELAIGELEGALALAQRLVVLLPDSHHAREQLARIAEWAARPLVALDQWTWLALRSNQAEHRDRAMALARAHGDHETLLALTLHARDAQSQPSPASDTELAHLYVKVGQLENALAVLEQVVTTHPDHRPAWDALLEIHRSMAGFSAVAEVWQRIDAHFGTTEAEIRAWAEMLWRADRPERALAVLDQRAGALAAAAGAPRKGATPEDETLRMIAELSWQLERLDRACEAYHELWRRRRVRTGETERLIAASRATGAVDMALAVATDLWQRNRKPATLLWTMQIAAEAGRWDALASLEARAESTSGALDPFAAYWRLRIARRQHRLQIALARPDFKQAKGILDDMTLQLSRGAQASGELVRHPDYLALWKDIHRQQIYVALQQHDYAAAEHVLDSSPELEGTLDYWRLRLLLRHQRLGVAVRQQDHERASAILDEMTAELARAAEHGADSQPEFQQLRGDMNRQKFYLALARQDLDTAAALLGQVDISEIDRMRVLVRLGRAKEAASVALAIRADGSSADSDAQRAEIDASAEELTRRMPRHVSAHARAMTLGELAVQELGQEIRYSWEHLGVGAQVTGARLSDSQGQVSHEAELQALGRWVGASHATELGVGASVSDDTASPRLDARHTRRVGSSVELGVDGSAGRPAEDTATLRPVAVRDHVGVQMSLGLGHGLIASGRLVGSMYRYREGGALGTGRDGYLSLGYELMSGPRIWNLRALGGTLTRSCADQDDSVCMPMPSVDNQVVALATTFTNGIPGLTATPVSRLRYSVDLLAGWQMPADQMVYSASLAIGMPIAGNDELSLSAELATAMDPLQGGAWHQGRRSIMIEYARSLWN